jgi:perosamine synthetase
MKKQSFIPLSRPDIDERDIQSVVEVLKTPYLSIGPKLIEFENKIADYIGRKFAIGVNSGTSALHLIIKSLKLREGDEVITTPFSFVASANCILFEGARPVFVDIEEETLNINPELIEQAINDRTKGILPVDVFGHPCDWDSILDIAQKNELYVIEDSCEALGAEYQGKRCGSFGIASAFGFYPNKQITTGEGGMIVTNDEVLANLCRSMRNQGRGEDMSWLNHQRLGYNFRLDEMSAALGISQLEKIEQILEKRSQVANQYMIRLREIDEVTVQFIGKNVVMSWFVFVIRFKNGIDRNQVILALKEKGVASKPYFPPIHLQPFYKNQFGYKVGDFPVTEKISNQCLALPFYNSLGEEEIDWVVDALKQSIFQNKK